MWPTKSSVAAFFERRSAALGPVDILVNNAGIVRDAHVMFLDSSTLARGARVNLDARVSLRARGGARHAAAPLGPDHQRVVAERADAAGGTGELCGVESRVSKD